MSIDFTVVVPAYNESRFIEPTLRSIRAQDFKAQIELIVVDNNSSDNTAEVAGAYADRVLRYAERQGAAAARQHGAENARGKNLVFIDADTAMSANLLSLAAQSLAAGVAGGRAPIRVDDASFGARWTEQVVNNWHRFIGPCFIPYLYMRREVFEKAGGWDLEITCAEEVRLQRRVKEIGELAWDRGGHTLTNARRYLAEGYYRLAFKGVLAQFFGVNHEWKPVRQLPAMRRAEQEATQIA